MGVPQAADGMASPPSIPQGEVDGSVVDVEVHAREPFFEGLGVLPREGPALDVLDEIRAIGDLAELHPSARRLAERLVAKGKVQMCADLGVQPVTLGKLRTRLRDLA